MPLFAVALLFGSAFLHTTWNLLLKQADEKYLTTWWAILLGSAVFLPFLVLTGLPARAAWPYLLASVLVESAYYVLLPMAYQEADFSLVYPLARGAAPALIATWSVLFLGERLTLPGIFGLSLMIIGLLVVGSSQLFQPGGAKPHLRGIFLALSLAVLISIYSTIDGAAVKQTPAFSYAVLVFFLAPVLTAPLVLRRYSWQTLSAELAGNRLRILSIGLLTVCAYLLALAAYSLAPVSYVGAIREISVVFGAAAGWWFLSERLGGWRVVGAAIIFSGLILITISG
jgi:drug/metabolite transporter (DMT)-like permease